MIILITNDPVRIRIRLPKKHCTINAVIPWERDPKTDSGNKAQYALLELDLVMFENDPTINT